MAFIPLIRIIALSVVLGFSVIVLGVGAAAISSSVQYFSAYSTSAGLAIAVAVITLVTLPVMIFLEYTRPGAMFTSMIAFELGWLSFLWILWLASAGESVTAAQEVFVPGCGYADSVIDGNCREIAAIEALSFLNWIVLMAYTTLILILTLIAATRKHSGVWKSSVADAPFFTPGAASTGTAGQTSAPMGPYGGSGSANVGGYYPGETGPASVTAGTVHG
ncbi:hypothetical protein B0H11DRAFT_2007240, partial [Mycena galericulata]